MKAILFSEYGPAEVLHLADVPNPTPKPNEVLVAVKAVSVNPLDWKFGRGYMAPVFGTNFPKRIGSDLSGVVQEVGKDVSNYKPGDEVYGLIDIFGGQPGSFAELIAVPASQVSDKPAGLTFAEAASIPVVGLTALQGMLNQAGLVTGETVLINGASGGVGVFAVQIAKILGATVTAVCSADNVETVRQLGADTVLDYKKTDVLADAGQFDLVFDAVGKWSFDEAKQLVNEDGRFLTTNPLPRESGPARNRGAIAHHPGDTQPPRPDAVGSVDKRRSAQTPDRLDLYHDRRRCAGSAPAQRERPGGGQSGSDYLITTCKPTYSRPLNLEN